MRTTSVILVALAVLGCGDAGAPPDLSGVPVVLTAEMQFATPEGEPVVLSPGVVTVAGRDGVLLVQSDGGPVFELAATELAHEVSVPGPYALVVSRAETGTTHLVLLLPDGRGFDAIGSPDGAEAGDGTALEAWEVQLAYSEAVADELREIAGAVPDRDRREIREILSEQEERIGFLADGGGSQYGMGEVAFGGAVEGVQAAVGRARARIDEPRIYLGDPGRFEHPATVDLDRVYAQIPEYREILDRDLGRGDASYTFLLGKASRRFLHAIGRIAEKDGYDLIGGKDAIRIPGEDVPNITPAVVPLVGD